MATGCYNYSMTDKPKKRRLSKEEREAYSIVGRAGGRAVAKKLGKKGMSELGRRGAKTRWSNIKKK